MTLIKLGESLVIDNSAIQAADSVFADQDIFNRFQKIATDLKQIAPKAKDFLYFSCIMMTAAEASLYDDDGKIKKDSSGSPVEARWEKKGESWKWICSDESIKPYKNANSDIFPSSELIKAYKKWIGKPLCLDHKSSSVDMIRGLILDTYYDRPNNRVVALCALDKKNYPDLARKVETGYATSVSMGTAVGRAICSDCGNVARIESEFCPCMRNRKCYGEINVDLNPIELSIVVNGADPKAKIRHIVAAANNLAQYVELKEAELNKLGSVDTAKTKEIEDGLDEAIKKLEALKQEVKELNERSSSEGPKETQDAQDADVTKTASHNTDISSDNVLGDIFNKLENLTNKVNKLSMIHNEDKKMATKKEGYFQGGGGVNEPTPGKPKYEKEDEDSIRDKEDKQMVGQMDTGPVDGMHPGYESFGESEEARKKRLLRLASEQEARQLRRQAALEKAQEKFAPRKEGYFMGGGGVNEPTPGKPKYEKEDEDSIRDEEDKQMVGAPPFPGVGKVDGLYSDDLKTKEKLLRAKLTAKFLEAAGSDESTNRAESRWQVYADKKLILSASVGDIAGGKVEALYDTIHSHDFGKKLLTKIRSEGLDKVKNGLMKNAADPATGGAPMAPAVAGSAGPAPDMGMDAAPDAAPVDKGGTGDKKDTVPELLDVLDNTAADLRKGIDVLTNKSDNELSGGFEGLAGGEMPPATASLVVMQKKLGKALLIGMKQASKDLSEHVEELKMAQHIRSNGKKIKKSDEAYVSQLIKDACDDAKSTVADCYKLMGAFVKYAHGTETLIKKAKQHAMLSKTSQLGVPGGSLFPDSTKKMPASMTGPVGGVKKDPSKMTMDELTKQRGATPGRDKALTGVPSGAPATAPAAGSGVGSPVDISGDTIPQTMPGERGSMADDSCMADDKNDVVEMKQDGTMTASTPSDVDAMMKAKKAESFDLTTKEGRTMYRTKLADKGLVFSDMLGKAHKGGVTTQLDVKPTGDLAKVETLEEEHKAMMDVAVAPPKVRKEASDIQRLVQAGKIDPSRDFPALIANGLDKDAVSYWKSFWGDAGKEGSQFATELVKEHAAHKAAEKEEVYRVKLSRAYEVAYDMVRKGMIGDDSHALSQQVNELMKFNDDGFSSMKRWVERQPIAKTASIPQVGLIGTGEVFVPAPEAAQSDFVLDLAKAFSNRKY
jgi:hypothetical protein